MTRRVMVSADLMALLGEICTDIMQHDGGIPGRDWTDQIVSSRASAEAGGEIRLVTDEDWKVAFLVWYLGNRDIAKRLPREGRL